jgi:CubicO group peptidase (beta-lactamase class C family)
MNPMNRSLKKKKPAHFDILDRRQILNSNYENERENNSEINVLTSNLQTFLDSVRKETGVPGVCLGLNIAGQNIVLNNGMLAIDKPAPMQPSARFQLGCITKLLTAMVTAEIISSGKIDPDDPIEKYLEELKGTERGKDIAIWHLFN